MAGSSNALRRCLQIFWGFLKLGTFTIGGGLAMIPQMQQVAVEEHGWLTEEEVLDCIAVSQSLPGIIAINMAAYIGRRLDGVRGAICACIGVVLPSFVIISLAVLVLDQIKGNPWVAGAFTGVKAAVCGLIAVSAVRLGKQTLRGPFPWLLMLAALAAVGLLGISAVWAILGAIVCGILYSLAAGKLVSRKSGTETAGPEAEGAQKAGIRTEDGEKTAPDRPDQEVR